MLTSFPQYIFAFDPTIRLCGRGRLYCFSTVNLSAVLALDPHCPSHHEPPAARSCCASLSGAVWVPTILPVGSVVVIVQDPTEVRPVGASEPRGSGRFAFPPSQSGATLSTAAGVITVSSAANAEVAIGPPDESSRPVVMTNDAERSFIWFSPVVSDEP